MIVALLASSIAVSGLVAEVGGLRIIAHVQHKRCLESIGQLESELFPTRGIDLDGAILTAQREADPKIELLPHERILGYCESCQRRVAVNAGRCNGGGAECAKRRWMRGARSPQGL